MQRRAARLLTQESRPQDLMIVLRDKTAVSEEGLTSGKFGA